MKWLKNIFVFAAFNLITAPVAFAQQAETSLLSRIQQYLGKKISFEADGEALNTGIFRTNKIGALKLGATIEKTIVVTNITNKQIVLAPFTISGAPTFSIKTNIAPNTRLEPGQKANVVVAAHPVSGYSHRATLSSPATNKLTKFRLNLDSVALSVEVTPAPKLSIYDGGVLVAGGGSVSLGVLQAGVPVQKTLTYKNDGVGILEIKSSFIFSKEFRFIKTPAGELAAGQSDELIVEFTPTEQGSFNIPMLIGSIDPTDSKYRVNFIGQVAGGIPESALVVYDVDRLNVAQSDDGIVPHNADRNSNFVYLGGAAEGSAAFSKTFRLYNSGASQLRIDDFASFFSEKLILTAPLRVVKKTNGKTTRLAKSLNQVSPAVAPGFPIILAAGESADVKIQFSPTASLIHTGYIEVRTNDPALTNYQFNVATAVSAPHGLLCSGDNNNWVAADFSCAGKANGTICGSSIEEKTKVCNQNQCVLMGDINNDDYIDSADLTAFISQMNAIDEPSLASDTQCTGNLTTITTQQVKDFASLLVDAGNNRAYNTRVVENCSHRDLSNDPTRGRALVFANGPINFEAMKASTTDGIIRADTPIIYNPQVEVCIDNLGMYDLDGNYTGGNNGITFGKYSSASVAALNLPAENLLRFGSYVNPQNDFRFSAFGDDGLNDPRQAVLRSGSMQLYHDVNYFRTSIVNDGFVKALKLSPEIELNLMSRQGRPDLVMQDAVVRARPFSMTVEQLDIDGIDLDPAKNFMRVHSRTRGKGNTFDYSELPPISQAFDRSFASADFAGLMFFWITQNNDWKLYNERFFGENDVWKTNIMPAINDGLSAWEAYRILGKTEVYKDTDFMSRRWSELGACLNGFIPCDKGEEVRNVMMFDSLSSRPKTVFPFSKPSGGLIFNGVKRYDGPVASGLSALFLAGLFYDMSVEAGLGDRNAGLIFWKSISLIQNPTALSMNEFALKILEAARILFPDPADSLKSIFEIEIKEVLFSRGITLNDTIPISSVLPTAVQSLDGQNFSSPNPNYQPDPNDYGQSIITSGVFTATGNGTETMLQFMKHSKLGPCDSLAITNGTFSSEGVYQNDGSYLKEFSDRDLNNLFIKVSGTRVSWRNIAKRCDTEFEGFYAEDLTSLGFRVVSARVDGFGIETASLKNGNYLFSVANDRGESFEWTISQPGISAKVATGSSVRVKLNPQLPVRLRLIRQSDGQEILLNDSLSELSKRKVL